MSRVGTKDFKVKNRYYYILDFRRFMYPQLMPVYFVNKVAAKRILKANIKNRNLLRKFTVIKGIRIKNENIPYKISYGNYLSRGGKYNYTEAHKTRQDKKSFRTLLRRRLRRMDLLTNNKTKFRYDQEKVDQVKYRRNYQSVANSPSTDAKVFQLDRKPRRYYYILLSKTFCKPNRPGKLFRLKVIQVNVKTGKWKKVTIYSMRNDIFIPELLANLKKIPNAAGAIEEYWRIYKRKQEKVLRQHLA